MMPFLFEQKDGTLSLLVYIQPRASRNRIVGPHGKTLKISITSPPVDNKANTATIAFIAKIFHIPKTAITIKSGQQSRTKHLTIENISLARARQLLDQELRVLPVQK